MIALVRVYREGRIVDQYNIDLPVRCLWNRGLFKAYEYIESKRAEKRQASLRTRIKLFVPKTLFVQILNRNFQYFE